MLPLHLILDPKYLFMKVGTLMVSLIRQSMISLKATCRVMAESKGA